MFDAIAHVVSEVTWEDGKVEDHRAWEQSEDPADGNSPRRHVVGCDHLTDAGHHHEEEE
jgi:hypothetical protein